MYNEEKLYCVRPLVVVHVVNFQRDLVAVGFNHHHHHHHHKHQGLDLLIRSVSTVTAARANASSVLQLFSFLVVCDGMISKGFGFVSLFASVETSSVCIRPSCLVCL